LQYSFYKSLPVLLLFVLSGITAAAQTADTTATSSATEAVAFLDQVKDLEQSPWWPAVAPQKFLNNLRIDVTEPLSFYEGSNTNFCSYAALTYLPLHDNPLGFVQFMLQLYKDGTATYGRSKFEPSQPIKDAAGKLQFHGMLDIRPADQMWILCLADHFKGYINFFNRRFNMGDESTFWASTNLSKFNRMVRNLFNYKTVAVGSDLIRPRVHDLYEYITDKMKTSTVVVYLNNTYLRKKNHNRLRSGLPTHYIIIIDMSKTPDGLINFVYWDYGFRTQRQVTPAFFHKLVFGITSCTKKTSNDN